MTIEELNELIATASAQLAIEKAWLDAKLYGAGFIKIKNNGEIEHIEREYVSGAVCDNS